MPITKNAEWKKWVDTNKDGYGGACVAVARKAMEMLDKDPKFAKKIDTHKLICDADDASNTGGITGFMAGCVAQMISTCHSRGEEFRKQWNIDNQIHDEAEKINKGKGVINPALLTVKV